VQKLKFLLPFLTTITGKYICLNIISKIPYFRYFGNNCLTPFVNPGQGASDH